LFFWEQLPILIQSIVTIMYPISMQVKGLNFRLFLVYNHIIFGLPSLGCSVLSDTGRGAVDPFKIMVRSVYP